MIWSLIRGTVMGFHDATTRAFLVLIALGFIAGSNAGVVADTYDNATFADEVELPSNESELNRSAATQRSAVDVNVSGMVSVPSELRAADQAADTALRDHLAEPSVDATALWAETVAVVVYRSRSWVPRPLLMGILYLLNGVFVATFLFRKVRRFRRLQNSD